MKARLRKKIEKQRFDAQGRTVFIGQRTGKRQICRLDVAASDGTWADPIMEMSSCAGEFARDWERKDLADGCPACIASRMP